MSASEPDMSPENQAGVGARVLVTASISTFFAAWLNAGGPKRFSTSARLDSKSIPAGISPEYSEYPFLPSLIRKMARMSPARRLAPGNTSCWTPLRGFRGWA